MPPAELSPEELALKRIRQIAFGLLVVAVAVEAAERVALSWRLRLSGAERRYIQRLYPKGAGTAEVGRSLLEATSARSR